MILFPPAIGLLATFTLGLSLIVATANTFYRDCGHLISVFLQAWYFATPILYRADEFPDDSQWGSVSIPLITSSICSTTSSTPGNGRS